MTKLTGITLAVSVCLFTANIPAATIEAASLRDILSKHLDRVMRKRGPLLSTKRDTSFTNCFGRVIMRGPDALPSGHNYIQIRDTDGWAEIRNESGSLIAQVEPIRDNAAFILGDYFGFTPSATTSPDMRLSYLVSKWIVGHSEEELNAIDVDEDERRSMSEAQARWSRICSQPSEPSTLTDLKVVTIDATDHDVTLVTRWPNWMTFQQDRLNLYTSVDLKNWTHYDSYNVAGVNALTTTVARTSIPGYLESQRPSHTEDCNLITNIVNSTFNPGVTYTNRHWNCNHKAHNETPGFFRWVAAAPSSRGFTEEWIRSYYWDKAENILSRGYENWVNDQIGYGLKNGYYKVVADVTVSDPSTIKTIRVGDQEISISESGSYSFLLEKGPIYDIETSLERNEVSFRMQDDISDGLDLCDSWWDGLLWIGLWEPYEGGFEIAPAYAGHRGYCYWIPVFCGTPDVDYIGENTTVTFVAKMSDYAYPDGFGCQWSCDDSNIIISSPNSITTDVSFVSFPDEGIATISATAYLTGVFHPLTTSLRFAYGNRRRQEQRFDVAMPELIYVNEEGQTSRWYKVDMVLSSPIATDATISIQHTGNTNPVYPREDMEFHLDNVYEPVTNSFYMSCSSIGSGRFTIYCRLGSGEVLTETRDYRVVDPLQRLVTSERKSPEDVVYNPSRIMPNVPVYLKIDVDGPAQDNDVCWRISEGQATLTSLGSNIVRVKTQSTSGRIVVEAGPGDGTTIRPRFVLPITEKRVIYVKAFVVKEENESLICDRTEIEKMISYANGIYRQVGIEFELIGDIELIADDTYSRLSEHSVNGSRQISQQCRSLLTYGNNLMTDTRRLFFVDSIINGSKLGFAVPSRNAAILSKDGIANFSNIAHELGHLLGLKDIYDISKDRTSSISDPNSTPTKEMFANTVDDWGEADGRGFYPRNETRRTIIRSLLMYGYEDRGVDIPSGAIKGLSDRFSGNEEFVAVGAERIGDW